MCYNLLLQLFWCSIVPHWLVGYPTICVLQTFLTILWALLYFLVEQDSSGSSCTFFAPVQESVIFLTWLFYFKVGNFETKIWVLGVLRYWASRHSQIARLVNNVYMHTCIFIVISIFLLTSICEKTISSYWYFQFQSNTTGEKPIIYNYCLEIVSKPSH